MSEGDFVSKRKFYAMKGDCPVRGRRIAITAMAQIRPAHEPSNNLQKNLAWPMWQVSSPRLFLSTRHEIISSLNKGTFHINSDCYCFDRSLRKTLFLASLWNKNCVHLQHIFFDPKAFFKIYPQVSFGCVVVF